MSFRSNAAKLLLSMRKNAVSFRNLKKRGGHSNESFFSEGKHEPGGLIFNETPPKAGESRTWESWEAPWCVEDG